MQKREGASRHGLASRRGLQQGRRWDGFLRGTSPVGRGGVVASLSSELASAQQHRAIWPLRCRRSQAHLTEEWLTHSWSEGVRSMTNAEGTDAGCDVSRHTDEMPGSLPFSQLDEKPKATAKAVDRLRRGELVLCGFLGLIVGSDRLTPLAVLRRSV